jgi:NIMA (never in mitosis gene a)-related kinase
MQMMEICSRKLQSIRNNGTGFEEPYIWKVFIQITKGLKALHELSIMHRDLKSANLFLNKDGTAKLGDMNVSKLTDMKGLNYTQTGTPYYASPEVWRDLPYDIKSDIWSLGWVLYEMIWLKPPFRASNMEGLFRKVSKGLYQPIPKKYSLELSNLVRQLLKSNPDKRPNCDDILRMPSISKKSNMYYPEDRSGTDSNELLKTIIFPKNLMYLTDQLPTPWYEDYEIDEKRKTSTLPMKHSRKVNNRKILSRSKISSGTKQSDNDLNSDFDKISSGSNPIDLSKAKKIMRNNLSKGESKRSKVDYKGIIKKQNMKPSAPSLPYTSIDNNDIMK